MRRFPFRGGFLPSSHRPAAGFTLLELLVVIVLLGVATDLGMVMFSKMSDAWKRTTVLTDLDARATDAFNEMRQDFAEVVSSKISGVALSGKVRTAQDDRFFMMPLEDDQVAIPVDLPTGTNGLTQRATVRYQVEREKGRHVLMRATELPGNVSNNLKVADGVLGIRFEYLGREPGSTWEKGWSKPVMPGAVRVSLTLMDPDRYYEQASRKAVFSIHVD